MGDKKKDPTFKEIHGETRVGKFLRDTAPNLLKSVLGIAGNLIPGASGVTDVISGLIGGSEELTAEQKVEALALLQLDMQNVANARDMQKAALSQDDVFSKRFVYYVAAFWSVIGGVYIFLVTFTEVENPQHANTIIGFLLGTIVATIINFFFGSSQGSKDKTRHLTL
jgi:hypothetical protein